MKKLILKNGFSPGDIVLLTAAVRDLHLCYPGQFSTDVRTPFPQLWEQNPHITPHGESEPGVEIVECQYPLINGSNTAPYHALHGFAQFLNDRLGLKIKPSLFKGDIYLSKDEKAWDSQVQELVGEAVPFWIIVAGGKHDVTIKWWEPGRYQQVVDHFRGRIQFVQVGASGHFHPKLRGVIDFRGKTDLRQLVRLVHHAQGVLCPVTLLMHLAAAVEVKGGVPKNRPCVVVAGGREPAHWAAYPQHQFIHTNGSLLCCDNGGCWKSRTLPLGDGDERDRPENLCVDVTRKLPRCMDMIPAEEVIRRIEAYFDGGSVRYLSRAEAKASARAVALGEQRRWDARKLEKVAFQRAAQRFIGNIGDWPGGFGGRGIVICGGGPTYFPCAWVCIKMLRKLGCVLPIELWHLGAGEFDAAMERLVKPLDVVCRDATAPRGAHAPRLLNGWSLKPYAILHSRFKEVLLIDADNVPVRQPDSLFRTRQFRRTGAVFWPDIRPGLPKETWDVFATPYRREPEFESGQILVNKQVCWKALSLAMWYNEHADYYYKYVLGDKDTFHMAFRKLASPFSLVPAPVEQLQATMCQHDFEGRRIFQHRNLAKWDLDGENSRISGFLFEKDCLGFLKELRLKWNGEISGVAKCGALVLPPAAAPRKPAARSKLRKGLHEEARQIVFRAPMNAYTGYGLHACQIAADLEAHGYAVAIRPTAISEKFAKLPQDLKRKFVRREQAHNWELLLHPPNFCPTAGKKTVFFTMWEATRLPPEWVGFLNGAECVVVPCQWNASCFSASGVNRPIKVVPLGIKSEIFRFMPMNMRGPCVFGAAGRMAGGGERKGLDEMIELFREAFPTEKDVRLRIKCFPDCGVPSASDPRVDVIADYLPERYLAKWYASLTCFISISRSEGWGLMPHQAMAVGRPCIAMRFGGHAEFFHESAGYCVNWTLAPAQYNYTGGGHWAEPDKDHVIELMRHVCGRRGEARAFGATAAASVSKLTWQRSNQELLAVLREVGMVR
ncbi:MAG TPA: glycosyltransferase [Verrucomicrobiota bacterium]|nr:glycosyltransferase [Verrucomicrobiota bacterium]